MNKFLLYTLKKYWGYNNFKFLQKEVILSIINKNDTMAVLPAGSGKSLCYQLPAILQNGICIVISPLNALIKDQLNYLNKIKIKSTSICGNICDNELKEIFYRCSINYYKIIYFSPEKFLSEIILQNVKLLNISFIAIDEAHYIIDWGIFFRPDYLRLSILKDIFPKIPILLLTANINKSYIDAITNILKLKKINLYQHTQIHKNIFIKIINTNNKLSNIVKICNYFNGSGIIYANTKHKTEVISEYLNKNGIQNAFYHSSLNTKYQSIIYNNWYNNKIKTIVTTRSLSVGIDKKNVKYIIHSDMPFNIRLYYQEINRSGRDGSRSFAILLYNKKDFYNELNNIKSLFPKIDIIIKIYNAIKHYLQINKYSSLKTKYPFDINEFSIKYNFNISLILKILKILNNTKYIYYNNNNNVRNSKIIFLISYNYLYDNVISNHISKFIINGIVRFYGGNIFNYYMNIDENKLSKYLNIDLNKLILILKSLKNQKIINYLVNHTNHYIEFLKFDNIYVNITQYYYKQLHVKNLYIKDINNVMLYINSNICRQNYLINTINNKKDNIQCNNCDICNQ